MPSPFPGMDPYLEDPAEWEGFHTELVVTMRHLLLPQVQPRYGVRVERRMYIEAEEEERTGARPDVEISRVGDGGAAVHPAVPSSRGRAVVVDAVVPFTVRPAYLKIIRRPEREVVTVIELLSAVNKRAGGEGHGEYLNKREEVLRSGAHFVEIDLLRKGKRPPFRSPLPPADYYAAVYRAGERPRATVYPVNVREPLPSVPVPLAAPDPDVWMDLGVAVRTAYEEGGYDDIDYAADPVPPLEGADREWADELLRAAGKR